MAAPAVWSRKPSSGRPGVTVRSNYMEPPLTGLDEGRTNEGQSPRDQGANARPRPGSYGPGSKIAAVERREARKAKKKKLCAERRRRRTGLDECQRLGPKGPGRWCFVSQIKLREARGHRPPDWLIPETPAASAPPSSPPPSRAAPPAGQSFPARCTRSLRGARRKAPAIRHA